MERTPIQKSRPEKISDTLLLIFITIPFLTLTIGFQSIKGFLIVAVFASLIGTPIVLIGLILIIAAIISLVSKISRFARGYRPATVMEVISDVVFVLPLAVIVLAMMYFSVVGKL